MRPLALLLAAFLLVSCAAPPLAPETHVSQSFRVPPSGAVVVVLPPQSRYPEFVAGEELVEAELARQIAKAGLRPQLIVKSDFDKVWREEVAAVGGLYDPLTGNARKGRYEEAVAAVGRRIAADYPAALIISSRLLLRTAELTGESAHWDGQSRKLPVSVAHSQDFRWEGTTRGLSVELTAVDTRGKLQFQTFGALLIPYIVDVARARSMLREDLFRRQQDFTDGVRIALSPLRPQ